MTRDTWSGNANQPMSFNRWNYTESNPINHVDPSGFCVDCYVFFFPGLGNNGINNLGEGEARMIEDLNYRTGATVISVYPYGAGDSGLANNAHVVLQALGRDSVVPRTKADEIRDRLLGYVCDEKEMKDFNVTFIGYSGGSQPAYSTAQNLTGTQNVDNFVLFGGPFRAHSGPGNIKSLWSFVGLQDWTLPMVKV